VSGGAGCPFQGRPRGVDLGAAGKVALGSKFSRLHCHPVTVAVPVARCFPRPFPGRNRGE
jgi:hypothetical protein